MAYTQRDPYNAPMRSGRPAQQQPQYRDQSAYSSQGYQQPYPHQAPENQQLYGANGYDDYHQESQAAQHGQYDNYNSAEWDYPQDQHTWQQQSQNFPPRGGANKTSFPNARPDPRSNFNDRDHLGPRDPNTVRPQSSRQYDGRDQRSAYSNGYDRPIRSAMAGDYQQAHRADVSYNGPYQPESTGQWNGQPQDYQREGPSSGQGWIDERRTENEIAPRLNYNPSSSYRGPKDYQDSRIQSRPGRESDRREGQHRLQAQPPPIRTAVSPARKPFLETTSPKELNYDNPFPVFPTKKAAVRSEKSAGTNDSGRHSEDVRRSAESHRNVPSQPNDYGVQSNSQVSYGSIVPQQGDMQFEGGRPPPNAGFSRVTKGPHQQQYAQAGNHYPEPSSAVDYNLPRPKFAAVDRPGSAPGFRTPRDDADSDNLADLERPSFVGHQHTLSAGQKPPNFDALNQSTRPSQYKQSDLDFVQVPSALAINEPPPTNSQYADRMSQDRGVRDGKIPPAMYSHPTGPPESYYPDSSGPSSWQIEQGDERQEQFEYGRPLERAMTSLDGPVARPQPQRNRTTDGQFPGPTGLLADQGPRTMLPRQFIDPRNNAYGRVRQGSDVMNGDRAGAGYAPNANDGRQLRERPNPRQDSHQNYDATQLPYRPRDVPDGAARVSPPNGLPSNRPAMENSRDPRLRRTPPGPPPINGPVHTPATGQVQQTVSRNGLPERQQSLAGGANGSRPSEDSPLQRPPPVRPGLVSPPTGPSSRPPPVRQYGTGSSGQISAPQRNPSDPSSQEMSTKSSPPTLTREELSRLRGAVAANPTNQKKQMELARKLIEASVVLASEDGKADAKTTSRNRAAYAGEAHKIIKKLVALGNPEAMFFLADSLSSGSLGLENDPKEAFSLYQAAAKEGHAGAAYRTAVCCEIGPEDGGGTRKDPVKAMQWYKRAAALGDVPAMYKLGMIQMRGLLGQPRNIVEGCTWLKRAADKADEENPHAVHELAILYETGNGPANIGRDPALALQLYMRSAKLGYKASQFKLGQAYEYGLLGFDIDARNSIVWYTRAAAQGEHQSELALSGWYLTGSEGILEHSDTEAYLWARKAASAKQPLPKAMFAMGYFTEVGIGCPRSLEEAKRWYGRAAAQGFVKAQERLEELRKQGSKAPPRSRERLSRTNPKQDADCILM